MHTVIPSSPTRRRRPGRRSVLGVFAALTMTQAGCPNPSDPPPLSPRASAPAPPPAPPRATPESHQNTPAADPGSAREVPTEVFFAYFTGNGEEGMKFTTSTDGRHFTPMDDGRPRLPSRLGEGLVRDPSIVRGPDGEWHAVWTTGWWTKSFGVAHSKDLRTWTEPTETPAMATVSGVLNTWAPEIHWDPEKLEYLVLWASTVRNGSEKPTDQREKAPDGAALDHRLWATTTRDFNTWTAPRVFFDPGFSVIDAVIVRDEARRRWVMIFKDERLVPEKKDLRIAFADRMQGPYIVREQSIAAAGTWIEGPTVLEEADGWTIYFDRYREGRFGAIRTSDWETFQPVEIEMPHGVRHGCVLRWTAPK